MKFRKTRIAPTPSGFLHLGNVLSFAITAALARKAQARILLRIDDLDRERVSREYVQDIFDTLNFMEISWDEGPRNYEDYASAWSQMHRLEAYGKALEQLKPHLFACDCSRTQIAAVSPDGSYPGTCRDKGIPLETPGVNWRLQTEETTQIYVNGVSATLPRSVKDFIVRKKDGLPAYQLASVVDDMHFGIDMIVRGQDLWDSTLAQLYLASLLPDERFLSTSFYHHPLLMESAEKKLSKSDGATSIRALRLAGKKPADIYAMIAGMMGITVSAPINTFEQFVKVVSI